MSPDIPIIDPNEFGRRYYPSSQTDPSISVVTNENENRLEDKVRRYLKGLPNDTALYESDEHDAAEVESLRQSLTESQDQSSQLRRTLVSYLLTEYRSSSLQSEKTFPEYVRAKNKKFTGTLLPDEVLSDTSIKPRYDDVSEDDKIGQQPLDKTPDIGPYETYQPSADDFMSITSLREQLDGSKIQVRQLRVALMPYLYAEYLSDLKARSQAEEPSRPDFLSYARRSNAGLTEDLLPDVAFKTYFGARPQ